MVVFIAVAPQCDTKGIVWFASSYDNMKSMAVRQIIK